MAADRQESAADPIRSKNTKASIQMTFFCIEPALIQAVFMSQHIQLLMTTCCNVQTSAAEVQQAQLKLQQAQAAAEAGETTSYPRTATMGTDAPHMHWELSTPDFAWDCCKLSSKQVELLLDSNIKRAMS